MQISHPSSRSAQRSTASKAISACPICAGRPLTAIAAPVRGWAGRAQRDGVVQVDPAGDGPYPYDPASQPVGAGERDIAMTLAPK